MQSRNQKRLHRKKRVRAKVFGTQLRPRLTVFRSLTAVYAQLIDDENGKTLCQFNSAMIKGKKNNLLSAEKVGTELAKIAVSQGIKQVVFDRSGYRYLGKIKALAEGARKGGLDF